MKKLTVVLKTGEIFVVKRDWLPSTIWWELIEDHQLLNGDGKIIPAGAFVKLPEQSINYTFMEEL
jgi:hypothetical protein